VKITVITPRYALAGVPLAQIRFAKALARRGHEVCLIVGFVDSVDKLPNILDLSVEVWNTPKVRQMFIPIFKHLLNEKPDIVFSAEDHLTAIVLLASVLSFSQSRISGSSRILPTDRLAYSSKVFSKGWFLKQTMRLVMWRANALTCVSQDMVKMYQAVFSGAPHLCVYNIIKDKSSLERSLERVNHPWLENDDIPVVVSAGTLTKRKGFADLIQAFALVRRERQARLIILGDGYLKSDLMTLVGRLDLNDSVDLPGNVTNPLKYFSRSAVFVLSSYAEGLPNVLVEAMMCGCTPVSTDCPTGPREVLQDGKYGYLVPMRDPGAMAAAIEQALDNPIPKALLAEAVEPFEENRVIDRHFEVLGLKG
jgi:glycosyltransferase involved in cell wall biosynthesis